LRLVHKSEKEAKFKKLHLISWCLAFLLLGLYLGWKNVPGFLKANFILLYDSETFDCLFEKNNLDTIYLDIPFKNLQKIEEKRNEAQKKNFLITSDDDLVKAEISTGENQFPCKLRLKGDLADHWSGDKWSMRVEMKNGYLIKGMSKFSLQDPKTRTDIEEWLYLQTLRREGCMTVRYEFVNLVLNGKPMGIYALEEHFSREMIEANKKREGVIVSFDDYFLWRAPGTHPLYNYDNIGPVFQSASPKVRNHNRISKNESLTRQKENAFNLIRCLQDESLSPSNIFDIKKFGNFLAITHLWNAEHVFGLDDINFYFNPITCLLEPIGFDAEPRTQTHTNFFTKGPLWVQFALKDVRFAQAYIENIERYTRDDYILKLKSEYSQYESNVRRLLKAEYFGKDPSTIWLNANEIFEYEQWEKLISRAQRIQDSLRMNKLVLSYSRPLKNKRTLEIYLRNATSQPVEIISFQYGNKTLNPSEIRSESSLPSATTFGNHFFTIPPSNGKVEEKKYRFLIHEENEKSKSSMSKRPLTVNAKFLGHSYTPPPMRIPIDEFSFDPTRSTINNDDLQLDSIPYKSSEGLIKTIQISAGIYNLSKPIYIPEDYLLSIEAGTSFFLSKNSTFVCRGSIRATGTKENPIIFTSSDKSWPGLLLINSDIESNFSHAYFSKIGGVGKGPSSNSIIQNGWTMTGGVTVYNSTVNFSYCNFNESMTEDALNIISSSFSLDSCTFKNILSDAFDGDFVKGEVKNCLFMKIKGDGVDFSGSQVSVTGCSFSDINDKAISVGEDSHVNVQSTKIDRVSFGVVSKDMSQVIVNNCKIEHATIAAFSAYQKKNSFGPAKMEVNYSAVVGSANKFLVQNGSSILHDDAQIKSVPLDVEKLYSKQ
jgi:hypothetical protein